MSASEVTYHQVCTIDGGECKIYRIIPSSRATPPAPISAPVSTPVPPPIILQMTTTTDNTVTMVDTGPEITFLSTRDRRKKR
jgi:hypothetical protein